MIRLLAENDFGDTREGGLAGPTGLLIIVLLVIGTVLLIRNMNSRLRKLPDHFESDVPVSPAIPPITPPDGDKPDA
ncbi:hypothetical protein GCM10009682_50300 [Luedemannella flava]|uniref:Secreted protein n=1 Tax=Luedemannella flava TaxID=349316 RepID=A0ABN2MF02_9ACTN